MSKLKIGVLASGRGSNFAAILSAIRAGRLDAEVVLLMSNRRHAGALEIAADHGIPALHVSPKDFDTPEDYDTALINQLQAHGANLVVLAGYLRLLSPGFIAHFRHRILNIHPALLPAFGGKGMYGLRVHEAVIARGCQVTGVTVHLVDEIYDNGPIVLQRSVPVRREDTPEDLAARVLKTEHEILPEALGLFAANRIRIQGGRLIMTPL